jgi:hypothetical protein
MQELRDRPPLNPEELKKFKLEKAQRMAGEKDMTN